MDSEQTSGVRNSNLHQSSSTTCAYREKREPRINRIMLHQLNACNPNIDYNADVTKQQARAQLDVIHTGLVPQSPCDAQSVQESFVSAIFTAHREEARPHSGVISNPANSQVPTQLRFI